MLCGAMAYIIGSTLPLSPTAKISILHIVETIQPILLFVMLYIAFCKVKPSDMRPHRWQLWIMIAQIAAFAISCLLIHYLGIHYKDNKGMTAHYFVEAFLLSVICPTATACTVVTQKLGGDSASTTSYTIFINIAVAVLIPMLLPITHVYDNLTFLTAFLTIINKVFPILIFPLLLAWATRYFLPKLHAKIISVKDLAFYLWATALALAIAITCSALKHSHESISNIIAIAIATFTACIFQFVFGWWVGSHYGFRVEAGQAMGQKNTIFIIWLGYTFLCPISATAGGFYSIWHNTINSYQLYKKRKADAM